MISRPEVIASDGSLEAMLHLPNGAGPHAGAVVCHPHPLYGGDMHNSVVMVACAALTETGIAALRFNFRGVGGSSGEHDNGHGEVRDVVAALTHLATLPEIDPSRMGLIGYSFGAMMALAAADARVQALVLVSPPARALTPDRLNAVHPAPLIVTGGRDHIAPPEALRRSLAALNRPVAVRVVGGADHSWYGYERDLAGALRPFLIRALAVEGA